MIESESYQRHLKIISKYVDAIVKYIQEEYSKAKTETQLIEIGLVYQAIISFLFDGLNDTGKAEMFKKLKEAYPINEHEHGGLIN